MDLLPYELIYHIAMSVDGKGLKELCKTNRELAKITYDERFWNEKLARDYPDIIKNNIGDIRKFYIDYSCHNLKVIPLYIINKYIGQKLINKNSTFNEIIDSLNIDDRLYTDIFNKLRHRRPTAATDYTIKYHKMICFDIENKYHSKKYFRHNYKSYTISVDTLEPNLTTTTAKDIWWNSFQPAIILSYDWEFDYTHRMARLREKTNSTLIFYCFLALVFLGTIFFASFVLNRLENIPNSFILFVGICAIYLYILLMITKVFVKWLFKL